MYIAKSKYIRGALPEFLVVKLKVTPVVVEVPRRLVIANCRAVDNCKAEENYHN